MMVYQPMQERAAISDALLPARNFGAVVSGRGSGERMTWASGVFNDWLVSSDSYDDSTSQLAGRVTWLPFLSEDESNLFHLGIGLRYSDVEEGVLLGTEPEFNHAPFFLETGLIEADNAQHYLLEASWRLHAPPVLHTSPQ